MNTSKIYHTILITGACGFLGRTLVERLLRQTQAHLILVCRVGNLFERFPKDSRLNFDTANLQQPEAFAQLLEKHKPDVVFHLAAIARLSEGEKDPDKTADINLIGTIRLINLCKKFGTKRFIFTSSDLAGDAVSTVGITKYLIERLIINNTSKAFSMVGIRIVNLINHPYSVYFTFLNQLDEEEPLTVTHPDMSRRFINSDMAADYLIWLMQNGKNSEMYVIDEPPRKIVDLAREMIILSKSKCTIRFIGAKPGEKLAEADYNNLFIRRIGYYNLAVFDAQNYRHDNVSKIIDKLNIAELTKEMLNVFFMLQTKV